MKGSVYWDHQNIYLLLKRSTFTLKWTNPLQTKKNTHQSITTSPTKLSLEYRHRTKVQSITFCDSSSTAITRDAKSFLTSFNLHLALHWGHCTTETYNHQLSKNKNHIQIICTTADIIALLVLLHHKNHYLLLLRLAYPFFYARVTENVATRKTATNHQSTHKKTASSWISRKCARFVT